MKSKYCMYCGHNLESEDRLEGCCNNCDDEMEANSSKVRK